MSQPKNDERGTESTNVPNIKDYRTPSGPSRSFGGGSGGDGGPPVDTDTKNYVDARFDAVRAQNDARFAEVSSKIDTLSEKVGGIRTTSPWQMISIAAGALIAGITVLGVMADRFDGGISAFGLLDNYVQEQRERDADQDARLDRVLDALEAVNAQPQGSPEEGQD